MRKLALLLLATLAVACSKSDRLAPSSNQGLESSVSKQEAKDLVGTFGNLNNTLVLNENGTYFATFTQEVVFDVGNRMQPAARLFPICETEEAGRYELYKRNDKSFIRFFPDYVNLVNSMLSKHGDIQYAADKACGFFVNARKNPFEQEFDPAGKGAIALHPWSGDAKFFDKTAHLHTLYETPLPNVMFLSLSHEEVDVTDYLGRYLAAAYAPDHLKVNGIFSPEEISYDPKERRFSYICNQCGFALDFYKTKITSTDGDFKIDRAGLSVIRKLTDATAGFFKLQSSLDQTMICEQIEEIIGRSQLLKPGLFFEVKDPTEAELTFFEHKVELYLGNLPQ